MGCADAYLLYYLYSRGNENNACGQSRGLLSGAIS